MKPADFRISTFTKLAAVASILLCALTAALWVRSFFVCDLCTATRRHTRTAFGLTQSRGGIGLYKQWRVYDSAEPQERWTFAYKELPLPPNYPNTNWLSSIAGVSWHGFAWAYEPRFDFGYGYGKAFAVIVPYPAVMFCFVVPTLIFCGSWQRSSRRTYRRLHGFCTRCGYDLRGTRDRCPECGHVPGQYLGKSKNPKV